MKVEIRRNKPKGWYWRIRATNGRVLCHSEIYKTLQAVRKTASLIGQRMAVRVEEGI